jgi:phosphinothricin acetyltransferase
MERRPSGAPAAAPIAIRAAAERDFFAIAQITSHYILTSTIHFGYEPVAPEELVAAWRAGRARYPWLVAASDDRVIGYAKAGVWRERAAYAWTTEVGLYVDPAERGRGVGRALYTALLAALEAAGFHSAVAGITLPNAVSEALHRALGFEPIGTVRDAGWKHGAWHDVAFWQRRLAPARHDPSGAPSWPAGASDPAP